MNVAGPSLFGLTMACRFIQRCWTGCQRNPRNAMTITPTSAHAARIPTSRTSMVNPVAPVTYSDWNPLANGCRGRNWATDCTGSGSRDGAKNTPEIMASAMPMAFDSPCAPD